MQFKKLLVTFILSGLGTWSFGQSADQFDKKIAADLKLIGELSARNDGGAAVNDSLASMNSALESYFRKEVVKSPAILNGDFKKSKENGLTCITSQDGNIRFYNWDNETGNTMHYFTDLAAYKTSNGIVAANLQDTASEGDPGCYYTGIFLAPTSKKIYLVVYGSIGSNRDKGQGITAYTVDGMRLVKVPIFHTATKSFDAIDYGYDYFSIKNADDDRPSIHFSPDMRKLYIPVVDKDGAFTKGSLVYVFDGNNYVFDKNAK